MYVKIVISERAIFPPEFDAERIQIPFGARRFVTLYKQKASIERFVEELRYRLEREYVFTDDLKIYIETVNTDEVDIVLEHTYIEVIVTGVPEEERAALEDQIWRAEDDLWYGSDDWLVEEE